MKFNKTSVFLTLFGVFLLVCLAMSVKTKFHEAMSCIDTDKKTFDLAKMPEEGGVFDPDAHVDSEHRDRPKKASLSFMDPLERVEPEAMTNKVFEGKFGLCSKQVGAPFKSDAAGSNCFGFCPDNASIYKTDAKGTNCYGFCPDNASMYKIDAKGSNCYGYCVANDKKSAYKKDAAGSNCFGVCPNDAKVFKRDAAGSNCFGKCDNNPDVWKVDAAGSNCFYMCKTELGPTKSTLTCCPDGSMRTGKDASCPKVSTTSYEFGFCPDGKTYKTNKDGTNCINATVSVTNTQFGFCPDGKTYKTNKDGTNCISATVSATNSFGFCPDGKTYKTDSVGSNCSAYPPELPKSCAESAYGCCPDGKTEKDSTGSNCAQVEPGEMYPGLMPYNTTTVFIPPPVGVPTEKATCRPEPAPQAQACAAAPAKSECPSVPNGWAVPGANSTTTMEPTSVQGYCPAPPPCPACARCPESDFECKKVPNYNRADKDTLPQAVLPNFSTFGM
jgi:hypothetical protein